MPQRTNCQNMWKMSGNDSYLTPHYLVMLLLRTLLAGSKV